LPPEDPRDALIRELTARVPELTAQVAELREQLGAARRAAPGNPGNSSLPPSGDDQPRRQPRRERRAAERAEKKRSRGRQPGPPGAAMRWTKPDETLDHYPQGACACGRVHVAERPDGLPAAPLPAGPRLPAMAVCLAVFQHVPAERAQRLISDLTGGAVSRRNNPRDMAANIAVLLPGTGILRNGQAHQHHGRRTPPGPGRHQDPRDPPTRPGMNET